MYSIRSIQIKDNTEISKIIREVSNEYGLAAESGYAVADLTVEQMFQTYQHPHSHYWVIVDENDHVLGGGGLAPLKGDQTILEIQKMYFLPQIRGYGFAKKILELCFAFAEKHHYSHLYLETTKSLWQAVNLYEKLGFVHLDQPLGQTGHSEACEIRMLKNLNTQI